MNPSLYFHVSYSFHKWFLYYKGDFDPVYCEELKRKVVLFEDLWKKYEDRILTLISQYTGAEWPYTEIHVYCFENPDYYDVPCISDPVSLNMKGENSDLHLLYLIHELIHVITQFDDRIKTLPLDTQEAVVYFVGNRILGDVIGEKAHTTIDLFTVPWPYDFCKIAQKYKGINGEDTVIGLIEKGMDILLRSS